VSVLPRRVRPEDWTPIGVDELEDNALHVVRSAANRSVIAGPGAGKTELLGQRAAYLLQSGLSARPRRILAISFKRDAATNLASRVRQRCHRSHAGRFDSLTFDAFAKGLVDRFGQALPKVWRPSLDYEIFMPNQHQFRDFLRGVGTPPDGARAQIEALSIREFERVHLLGSPLPIEGWPNPAAVRWAVARYWAQHLRGDSKSYLSFPMIGRLAELIVRANPMVRTALQLTYSHLFMDEFQDTTSIQYDLVKSIFLGSDAVITAVGDNKQQIMRWAMAMDAPFDAYEADFKAKRIPLYNNYRSSPDLVRIQHVLARALDKGAVAPVSKAAGTIPDESCVIWDFATPDEEAAYLAEFVKAQMEAQQIEQRDFVILVRQKASEYAAVLTPAFSAAGMQLRNEAGLVGDVMLQELLAEELSQVVVSILRTAMMRRAGRHWTDAQEAVGRIWGITADDEAGQTDLAKQLNDFGKQLRTMHPTPPTDESSVRGLIEAIVSFLGRDRLVVAHPAYRQGTWFSKVLEASVAHLLTSSTDTNQWSAVLDAYEGISSLPLMTIHKSKGLEYHTVIFVGLDDGAWWSFDQDKIEGTAGFFVAFTRAKQRVVFTYCARRGARNRIATLYELLRDAGVDTISPAEH